MGGGSVQAPQPSMQELQMMSQETNLLKQAQAGITQSNKLNNLLAPYLYQSIGLTPQYDKKGNISGFTQDPAYAATQQKQNTLTNELLDREQSALEGKLPVDPGLITQLGESENQLKNEMTANLGPGWETSTSGSTAMNQWSQYKSNILDAARRGDLTMAEQLALGMQGGAQSGSQFLMSGASGIAGQPANLAQGYTGVAQGYSTPLGIMENTRQLQMNADMFNSQQTNQMWQGLGQGAGTLAGMALFKGLPAGFLSTREAKEEEGEVDVLGALKHLPIKSWRYKKGVGQDRARHIGPYAEDFRDAFNVGDGKTISLLDYLGVNLAATKAVAKELERLASSSFLEA